MPIMFAVIATGGKQYLAKEGEILTIEKLEGEKGEAVIFDHILLTAEEDGSKVDIGTPELSSKVTGEIVEQGRAKKIEVVKYKAKVRYRRRVGHRQPFTKVKITKIS
jgi:large subunit ribosomal protein L21